MTSKVEKRREALRQTLLVEAEAIVAEHGLSALKARDLAERAGCAVGAIYTHFTDLDALAAALNAQTLQRLEAEVARVFATLPDRGEPKTALVTLGTTYARFVAANPLLWSANFELGFRSQARDDEAPGDEHQRLLGTIVEALRPLLPDAARPQLERHARALFSAVHGIVSLAGQRRFMAVPEDAVAAEIAFVVEAFCEGLERRTTG